MKKILMKGDTAIIDGVEITYDEIKTALVEQHKFNQLTNFLQTTFKEAGVSNE